VFHLLNRIYGRSVTPGRRRRPWGDLVVPTGWRQWGRSMDFPSFCLQKVELEADEYRMNGYSEIEREKENLINATSISLEQLEKSKNLRTRIALSITIYFRYIF
jgi:hypothetical protein